MPFLTERIYIICKRGEIYGEAGEEVSIVTDEHEDVIIVENANGIRYSVRKEKLSDNPDIDNTKVLDNPVVAKKTRKTATLYTPSLF